MSARSKISAMGLLVGMILLASCGGYINLPVPNLVSTTPTSVTAGAVQFTLAANGSGFAPSSTITFDGIPQPTIFLSQSELTTLVEPSEISSPGPISVEVTTPAPGGGVSAAVTFTVNPSTALTPQITSLSPASVSAAADSANVTVNGLNFISTSVVTVDGANRPTSFTSPTALTVTLSQTDLAMAGTLGLAVENPPVVGGNPPGGGQSNAMLLAVVNPVPVIGTISPPTLAAGAANTGLGVSGSGLDEASEVFLNGSARPTSFVSSTRVSAQLASQDIAAAGTYPVQVVNPAPGGGVSTTLFFSVIPASNGLGLPELVDVSNDGAQANNGVSDPSVAGPTMDSTGRYVAFASPATNLLLLYNQDPTTNPDTNGVPDIFLRDTCFSATTACTPTIRIIDVGPGGVIANGAGSDPALNSGGNEMAFISLATNLVAGVDFDGVTPQAFITSTCASSPSSCTPTVSLASIAGDGVSPANADVSQVAISGDGRFIAFVSTATNLVGGATTGAPEVYLRDTCLNAGSTCTPATILISAAPNGVTPADGTSMQPVVASGAFGQVITFSSTATNLIAGSGGVQEIYGVQLCRGISTGCTATHAQLFSTTDGKTFANGASSEPAITPDGRFVGFASTATNLGAASGGVQQIYLRDTCEGQGSGCKPSTTLVSVGSDGVTPGNGLSERPDLGNTPQYVAFSSLASNLVSTNLNGIENVFVRNTCIGFASGCTKKNALISVSAIALPGNGASLNPVLTGTSYVVAFFSAASNLVNDDLNVATDIFLAVNPIPGITTTSSNLLQPRRADTTGGVQR